METLAWVFLAIIAFSALLQAAFVAALALGLRKAEAEVDAFAARYDEKILPVLERIESVTGGMAEASQGAVEKTRALELRLSSLADAIGRRVEQASGGVADTFDETSEAVETYVMPGLARRRGLLGQARAVWSGVRQGLALFRG